MITAFAVCALVMSGWVSQDLIDPLAPSPETLLPSSRAAIQESPGPLLAEPQPARGPSTKAATLPAPAHSKPLPQPRPRDATGNRPTPAAGSNSPVRPRMPLSPTDPRLFGDNELPFPPTMDNAGTAAGSRMVANRPSFVAIAPRDNGDRRTANDKPLEHRHHHDSAVSPYMLLYSSTANGTLSTYNAYVRPALARQQTEQRGDEPLAGQGEPVYPSVFLNHGPYYHDGSDAR
jgi:hypothetical protein